MEIYRSENIEIIQHGDMLIQEWTSAKLNIEVFRKELRIFLSFYEKVRPKSVLWLQENFKLQIPSSLYNWIENDIVKRQYETGMKNLGFTVSADMLSHLSVMASFEKVSSVIQPNFFTDKNIAVDFLDKKVRKQSKLKYVIEHNSDHARVNIDLDFDLLPKVIFSLNKIEEEQKFVNSNIKNIQSLTSREMEIFILIVNGYSSKEIGIKLYIETSTIGTHRKNIVKKLHIKRPVDWFLLAKAFDLFN